MFVPFSTVITLNKFQFFYFNFPRTELVYDSSSKLRVRLYSSTKAIEKTWWCNFRDFRFYKITDDFTRLSSNMVFVQRHAYMHTSWWNNAGRCIVG